MKKRVVVILVTAAILLATIGFGFSHINRAQAQDQPEIFQSGISAGCYIAEANVCKIHVEPMAINIQSGSKMYSFRLVLTPASGSPATIYDFATDTNNPPPASGTIFYPSQVALDFAARCGVTYTVNLQGRDTMDANLFSLGTTRQFTCPSVVP